MGRPKHCLRLRSDESARAGERGYTDVAVRHGVLVGQCATTEGRVTMRRVHRRVVITLPEMLPMAVDAGRGTEESMSITGGFRSTAKADLMSERKAAATDGRAMKSHTYVGL